MAKTDFGHFDMCVCVGAGFWRVGGLLVTWWVLSVFMPGWSSTEHPSARRPSTGPPQMSFCFSSFFSPVVFAWWPWFKAAQTCKLGGPRLNRGHNSTKKTPRESTKSEIGGGRRTKQARNLRFSTLRAPSPHLPWHSAPSSSPTRAHTDRRTKKRKKKTNHLQKTNK